MRDHDALLASLINIDCDSLIAILSAEAEAAERLAQSTRQRTASQRSKRRAATERAARINRILLFLQYGKIEPDMPEAEVTLCESLARKLQARGQS